MRNRLVLFVDWHCAHPQTLRHTKYCPRSTNTSVESYTLHKTIIIHSHKFFGYYNVVGWKEFCVNHTSEWMDYCNMKFPVLKKNNITGIIIIIL